MIVYRLEDENGRGPFSSRKPWAKRQCQYAPLYQIHGCTVVRVTRFGSWGASEYRFGCRTKTQLKRYWGCTDCWEAAGWKVQAYRVRKNYIQFGEIDIELAFLAEKAEKVII